MAILISHTGSKTNPNGNSFVMRDEAAAADIMFRLEFNGVVTHDHLPTWPKRSPDETT